MRRKPSEVSFSEFREQARNSTSLRDLARRLNLTKSGMLNYVTEQGVKDDLLRIMREEPGKIARKRRDAPTPDEQRENADEYREYERVEDGVHAGSDKPHFDYKYDDENEIYVFNVNGEPLLIKRDSWRFACARFSEKGQDWTVQEVADELGLARSVLAVCFKKHSFFKANPPFTNEDFKEMSDEELDEETIEHKRKRYHKRIDRKSRAALEKENAAYRIRELNRERIVSECAEEFRTLVGEMAALPTRVVRLSKDSVLKRGGEDYYLHAPVADLHAGKLVWGEEVWGEDYDLDKACQRLVDHAYAVAEYINRTPGKCLGVYFTDLGDTFHAINWATENGTPLHQDSRPVKVWGKVVEAKTRATEIVRAACDSVEILGCGGNHEGNLISYQLYHALALRYEGEEGVNVSTRIGRYNHFVVGDTMHLLDHGKHLGKLNTAKTKAELEIEMRRVAGEDFYRTRHTYVYLGHLHEYEEAPQGAHMEMIRLPAFSETDDYETDRRYYSEPHAMLFKLNAKGRRVSQEHVHLSSLTDKKGETVSR